MDRRPHRTGVIPPTTSAFLPPLVRQRFPLYSFYGLARPMTARMAFPAVERVDVLFTSQNKLCGNYVQVDDKTAEALRQVYDKHKAEKNEPASDPSFKVALQVQFAPQVVFHKPFHPSQMMPGSEVDPALLAVGVNFAFHKEKEDGFEFSVVLQGSFNYSFVDPNRDDPNETAAGRRAYQGQLQLQGSYNFVNAFKVNKLTISLLVPAAGALTYQYDPTARKALTSPSGTLAGGVQIMKGIGSSPFSFGVQSTVGGGSGKTGDFTEAVIFQGSFDLF